MKGDFSRVTFDPSRNFTRVLLQQGRVQLDADGNEQAAILLHYLRSLAADLIGPFGGPGDSFKIGVKPASNPLDLTIGKGHYYVDGWLCENPADLTYSGQRSLGEQEKSLPTQFPFLVYLDVWERHVTWVQDDSIREVALGRLDTATRAQLVWQVRAVREAAGVTVGRTRDEVMGQWQSLVDFWQPANRGRLKARAKMDGDDTDACTVSPEARYRGDENQLYRVEIQSYEVAANGSKALTFKWSRENGSVIFPVRDLDGMTATLESLGRDEATGLQVGNWVEIVDDVIDLSGKPGPLLKVKEINAARATVTLEGETTGIPVYKEGEEATRNAYLRRWDHQEMAFKDKNDARTPNGGVLFVFGQAGDGWLDLEKGIQVQFQNEGTYRPGDYWLIPARTVTGDVEWPGEVDNPTALPPHGVEHHFAPLAIVTAANAEPVHLRKVFTSQAE